MCFYQVCVSMLDCFINGTETQRNVSTFIVLVIALLLLSSSPRSTMHQPFLRCLLNDHHTPATILTARDSNNFHTLFNFSIQNPRIYAPESGKPLFIVPSLRISYSVHGRLRQGAQHACKNAQWQARLRGAPLCVHNWTLRPCRPHRSPVLSAWPWLRTGSGSRQARP